MLDYAQLTIVGEELASDGARLLVYRRVKVEQIEATEPSLCN